MDAQSLVALRTTLPPRSYKDVVILVGEHFPPEAAPAHAAYAGLAGDIVEGIQGGVGRALRRGAARVPYQVLPLLLQA